MQNFNILTVFTLLFAALALAAPVVVDRQIKPIGGKSPHVYRKTQTLTIHFSQQVR